MPQKPRKWKDELLGAGPNYIEALLNLGPRPGESKLAFEIRLGGILRGREILLEACSKSASPHDGLNLLGVGKNNSTAWLRRLGLRIEDLETACLGSRVLGLPGPERETTGDKPKEVSPRSSARLILC